MTCRARGRERGSGVVEFSWLVILLLAPVVYMLLAVFDVQRASYGAAAASRAAGRAFVLAPDQATGHARAQAAAQVALADQGVDVSSASVHVSCEPTPGVCLTPGSTITVLVSVQQSVPLVPDVLGGSTPTIRVSSSHAEPYGTFREPRP